MTETADVSERFRVDQLGALLEVLEAEGDEAGQARAWHLRGFLLFWLGQAGDAEVAMARSLALARSAGDRPMENEALQLMTALMLWGPMPVEDGLRRGEEILPEVQGSMAEAWLLGSRACLLGMVGRFEEGRTLLDRADALAIDLGMKLIQAANHPRAEFELFADNPEGVVDRFVPAVAELERMGERGFMSTTAGYVAEAMYRLGRVDEAERYSEITRANASEDDVASQVQWRSVRGKLLARRGELEEGERLAEGSLELAAATDQFVFMALACADLAEVLRIAGKEEEARRRYLEAADLYDRKGATHLAARARRAAAGE